MDYPMHPDLAIGNRFPDFELPDHTGRPTKLSEALHAMPGVLVFNRGSF